jgi:hypothetical protein
VPNEPLDESGREAFATDPEAWEPWETTLVALSLALGVAGLLLLGWLVNRFILP